MGNSGIDKSEDDGPPVFYVPPYLKGLVVHLTLPYTSFTIDGSEMRRILWRPVILYTDGPTPETSKFLGYFYFYADNMFLGSCWGLLSGYTSGAFFRPPPKFLPFMGKNKLLLAPLFATRVIARMAGAGMLYDGVERLALLLISFGMVFMSFDNMHPMTDDDLFKNPTPMAEYIRKTTSTFTGLTALAFLFRVARKREDNKTIRTYILGGYLVGSTIAKILHMIAIRPKRKD